MAASRIWQADWDKPHRCPACHAVVTWAGFRPGITYACGTCGTRFARRWDLPPVRHPHWSKASCLRDYLGQNWDLRVRTPWAFREIRHPRSWWHVWGEQGPLIRGLALACWKASGALGRIPGLTDALERMARGEAGALAGALIRDGHRPGTCEEAGPGK